ncbi:MAG: hypothetical protein WBG95_14365 [Sulfitobacter sp.]
MIANAKQCTTYEAQVFHLVEQAEFFQNGTAFRDYGWSSAGPTNGWLDRFKDLRDIEDEGEDLQFFRDHGFSLANVYQVADEYRTSGFLDSFYQEMEISIQNAEPCNP